MTAPTPHTVALDVMGADNGTRPIVLGGVEAARNLGERVHVALVGRRQDIEPILSSLTNCPSNLSIKHADGVVPMQLSAMEGVRIKDSSIAVGAGMVKSGEAHAFVSAGNTGAVMAASLFTLGRIEGVSRPAISSLFPSTTGRPTVVVDAGANADCKPVHLAQFGVMGSVYSSIIFNHESPRVGLLSIGEERSKGNELIFNAQRLLKDSSLNFVGNVEGGDILSGTVDVVVTDGFTGNILLKFGESIKPMLVNSLQQQIQTNIFSRVASMFMLPFLRRMKAKFDYEESGGAPLLGVNGVVIICHGKSSAKAMSNAVAMACEMAAKGIMGRIQSELTTNQFGNKNEPANKSEDIRNGVVCASATDDKR